VATAKGGFREAAGRGRKEDEGRRRRGKGLARTSEGVSPGNARDV
jgi:hypothetical protein